MNLGESHMRAWIERTGAAGGAEIRTSGDCLWAQTGVRWPMFNGGIGAETESVLAALEELDPENGPPFFWWATDEDVEALRPLLSAAAIQVFDDESPWMQAKISDLPAASTPEGGELVEVTNLDLAREWCDVLVRGFEFPPVADDPWFEAVSRLGLDESLWRLWIARHEGEPAGVTLGFNGGGIAGLFGMAVLPEFRGLGYGALLTLHPLHAAATAGETTAGFFATESGFPLYESLGFKRNGSMTRWLGGASPF